MVNCRERLSNAGFMDKVEVTRKLRMGVEGVFRVQLKVMFTRKRVEVGREVNEKEESLRAVHFPRS